MTATALLSLKQQLSKLSERERREISAFLIKLRHETPEWKAGTATRLERMERGEKTSVKELRRKLRHAK
jgi:hypothetical protein